MPKTKFVAFATVMVPTLLMIPVGLSIGVLISVLGDFGVQYTIENIRLNSESFAAQYGSFVVVNGWISLVAGCGAIVLLLGKAAGSRRK